MNAAQPLDQPEKKKGFRVYQLPGVEKTVVARKGGPSVKQIKESESYKELRNNQKEFGEASHVSKIIRSSFPDHLSDIQDSYVSGKLTARIRNIIQKAEGPTGRRPILLSKYRELLPGFDFGKKGSFRDYYKADFMVKKGSHNAQLIFHFNSYTPEEKIVAPKEATHFKVFAHLISLSDRRFDKETGEYELMNPSVDGVNSYLEGPVRPLCRIPIEPMTRQASLIKEDTNFAADTCLILTMGIRFFKFQDGHYCMLQEGAGMTVERAY